VAQVRGTLRAVCWKERRDVYILTNVHAPPIEGNFTQESGQATRPCVVEDYMHTWGLWTNQIEWSTAMELPTEQETFFI
jgi:hypothetical protein